MARDYTTTALIESVERRTAVKANSGSITAEQLLAYADDELQSTIVPLVLNLRADHFLTREEYDTSSDEISAGSNSYPIPSGAMNRSVQNVVIVDDDGHEQALIYVDRNREIDQSDSTTHFPQTRLGYYFIGDSLYLWPEAPTDARTLRVYYYSLPNHLVRTNKAILVDSVNSGTNTVTASGAIPATITAGESVCCVAGSPGFQLRFSARTVSSVAAPEIVLSSVTGIVAGDYIALEGDSPIPQIPIEAHPLLAQAAAIKVVEFLGDREAMLVAQQKYQSMEEAYKRSYENRSEQGIQRIIGRNRIVDYQRRRWF